MLYTRDQRMTFHEYTFLTELLEAYKTRNLNWADTYCCDTIEQLREYVNDYLDWLYDARRKAETALQSEEREIWHKHGGYVSDENGNNPADGLDGYLRDIETATEQIELIESTLFGPEPVDLGADTDGAVL